MKKVLVYTDSRGQHTPRNAPVHDVFGVRLAKRTDIAVDLFLCPMKWTTTIDFLDLLAQKGPKHYDLVVLHTGIVDWSPRPQPSAINDLYNNQQPTNLGNSSLNTRDYAKKVVNNKKSSFDALFTEREMQAHLARDYGVSFEGSPTANMYSLDMAAKYLIPRLQSIDNLVFVNSNRFVPGWKGDHARGRPENIALTEQYSALFRDKLGKQRVVDLLAWNMDEIKRYTCDNIHLTQQGSDLIYERICDMAGLNGSKPRAVPGFTPPQKPFVSFGSLLEAPRPMTVAEKESVLASVGLSKTDKLASLIIGVKLHEHDRARDRNLRFLLRWLDHFYGDLFEVLIVEQDTKSRAAEVMADAKPYVRHEFLYNPNAYNRGWGYNVAVKHMTKNKVVALLDTDVLTNSNFVDVVVDCHKKYKAVSPYSHVYFTDPEEADKVIENFSFDHLRRENGVSKPTTITGGVVVIRRDVFESVAGFEQYIQYAGEDRSLDVTLINHCASSELHLAKHAYVHLYHPPGSEPKLNTKELLAHLKDAYGCTYDPKLTPADSIHKHCQHVSKDVTARNILERRVAYGDPDLYRSGRPLTVNGVYKTATSDLADKVIYPPDFTNLSAYEAKELYKAPDPDTKLAGLYNAFKGKRCFIIGNGPSLNKHDLNLLKGEFVFAVNSFYYKTDETGFRPTFFVVEDNAVMKENIDRIRAYDAPFKFFPTIYKSLHPEGDFTYFFRMNRGFYEKSSPNYCVPRFSTDASKVLYCGQSVTYINLQLAYYMGFTEVHLIGMDFSYDIPATHERRGDLIISTTDDPNHFHKDYFGKGKTWKDPKLDRVAMNYREAKLSFEAVGRKVYNTTIGGKLEIFDRADYDKLLREGRLVVTPAGEGARAAPNAATASSSPPIMLAMPNGPAASASGGNVATPAAVVAAAAISAPAGKPGNGNGGLAIAAASALQGAGVAAPSSVSSESPVAAASAEQARPREHLLPVKVVPRRLDAAVDVASRKRAWSSRVGFELPDDEDPQVRRDNGTGGQAGDELPSAPASIVVAEPGAYQSERATAEAPIAVQHTASESGWGGVVPLLLATTLIGGGAALAFWITERGAALNWVEWVPVGLALALGVAVLWLARRIEVVRGIAEARMHSLLSKAQERQTAAAQAALGLTSEINSRVQEASAGLQDALASERQKRMTLERQLEEAIAQATTSSRAGLDEARNSLAGELQRRLAQADAAMAAKLQQSEERLKKAEARLQQAETRLQQSDAERQALDRKASDAVRQVVSSVEGQAKTAASRVDGLDNRVSALRREIEASNEQLRARLVSAERVVADASLREAELRRTLQEGLQKIAADSSDLEMRLHQALSAGVASLAGRIQDADRRQGELHERLRGTHGLLETELSKHGTSLADSETRLLAAMDEKTAAVRTALAGSIADWQEELGRRIASVRGELARHASDAAANDGQRQNALDEKLGKMAQQVAEADRTHSVLMTRLQEVQARVTQQGLEHEALQKRLTEGVDAKFAGLTARAAQADKRHADFAAQIDANSKKLAADLATLEKRLTETAQTQAAGLATRLAEAEKRQQALSAGLEAAQTKLSARAAETEKRSAQLATEQQALQGKLASQGAELAEAEKRQQALSAGLEAAQTKLSARAAETEKKSAQLATEQQALQGKLASQGAELAEVEKRLAKIAADQLQQSLAKHAESEAKIAAVGKEFDAARKAFGQQLADVVAGKGKLRDELQTLVGRVKTTEDGVGTNVKDLAARLTALAKREEELAAADARQEAVLKDYAGKIEKIAARLDPLKSAIDALKAETDKAAETTSTAIAQLRDPATLDKILNPLTYQAFNRRLTSEHMKTLETNWLKRLSVPMSRPAMTYLAHRIRNTEAQLQGRLATSMEDAVLRALVAKAVKGSEVNILEIGTLFGVGAAILYDAVHSRNRKVHLTLVDPLEGYYDGASLDPATQLPVDRATVLSNLHMAGVDMSDVTLIEHLSTDPEALSQAKRREYDVIIIDGDHSFAGVATDFALYAPLVKVGGYVVFDDYNKSGWPDVKRFVDEEMPKHPWCMPVGFEWTTAVFRIAQRPTENSVLSSSKVARL